MAVINKTHECENECESTILFKVSFLAEDEGYWEYFCPECLQGIVSEVPEIIKSIVRVEGN